LLRKNRCSPYKVGGLQDTEDCGGKNTLGRHTKKDIREAPKPEAGDKGTSYS